MTAEEYVVDCTRRCSNVLVSVEDRNGDEVISYHEWITPEQALRAVEMAKDEVRQQIMKDAIYIDYNSMKAFDILYEICHILGKGGKGKLIIIKE